jgi:hypothetical protein
MKVQLGDREVWIEFAYRMRKPQNVEQTQCILRDGSAPRGHHEDAPVLAVGRVSRFFKDPPNRELARKAALSRALEDLDNQGLPFASFLHDQLRLAKERRKLFWQTYLNRKQRASDRALNAS